MRIQLIQKILLMSIVNSLSVVALAGDGFVNQSESDYLTQAENSCDGYQYAYTKEEDSKLHFFVCKQLDNTKTKLESCRKLGGINLEKVKEKVYPYSKSFLAGYSVGMACSLAQYTVAQAFPGVRIAIMGYNNVVQTLSVEDMQQQVIKGERQLGQPPGRDMHYLSFGQKLCSFLKKDKSFYSLGNQLAVRHISSFAAINEGMLADSKLIWMAKPEDRVKLFEIYQKNVNIEQEKQNKAVHLLMGLARKTVDLAIHAGIESIAFASSEEMAVNLPSSCISNEKIDQAESEINHLPDQIEKLILELSSASF